VGKLLSRNKLLKEGSTDKFYHWTDLTIGSKSESQPQPTCWPSRRGD
jgi:hypothetical protein